MGREEEEEEEGGGGGGGGACMGFGSWEEQIYWSHFQYTHFSRLLLPGFDKSLAIPDHFSMHVRKKLPETVGLKGPSGITWKVGLVARGCTMFFAQGWDEFVKDHSLQQNDLLVFKYDGDSTFEVTMFDRRSSCEIAATYFVRRGRIDGELRNAVPSKRNTMNCSPVLFHDAGTSKKFASDEIDKLPEALPTIPAMALKATKSKEKNKAFDVVDIADSVNASPENKKQTLSMITTRGARHRALKSAEATISKKGFTIVMTPSRLTGNGRYHARIPPQITKYLAFSEKQDVILRMNSNSWPVKLVGGILKNPQSDKGGSFSGGWKNFVMDNNFQEYDVCAFEPVVSEQNSIVLNVQIFRVEDHES